MTIMTARIASIILGGCLAASVVSGPVFAVGDDSSTTPVCKRRAGSRGVGCAIR